MSCIVIDSQESKKFYALHNNEVKEIGYSANPVKFSREGVIFYEKIPYFNFFIYGWLWHLAKRRDLYLSANNNMICKIRCEGLWWGWHVYTHINRKLPSSCAVTLRESETLVSLLVIEDHNLQRYNVINIAELNNELSGFPKDVGLFQFGLTDADILQIDAAGFKELHLNIDPCKSLEEYIAKCILINLSVVSYTRYFAFVMPILIINICINIYAYIGISQELSAAQSEMQICQRSILFNVQLPKKINWPILIYRLLIYSAIEKISIRENKISVITNNPRKVKSILKKAGFSILSGTPQLSLISSLDKGDIKIEAIKND